MKITYKEFAKQGTIDSLNVLMGKKINVKTSIILADFMDEIAKHVKTYSEQMELINKRNIEKDEEGEFVPVDEKDLAKGYKISDTKQYNKDIKELGETEVKFKFNKIKLDSLPEDIEIEPTHLRNIRFIFE